MWTLLPPLSVITCIEGIIPIAGNERRGEDWVKREGEGEKRSREEGEKEGKEEGERRERRKEREGEVGV